MEAQMPGFAIDSHPQKTKIIDQILAGKPTREIADTTSPPVSFNAIQRYKTSVIMPMLARAEESNRILKGDLTTKPAPKPLSEDTQAIQKTSRAILDAPALQIRENRVRLNQEITSRLVTVINERAADMSVCENCRRPMADHPGADATRGCAEFVSVPGGSTGLIVRKLKQTGTEYALDTGLLSEIREHEKHVAIELGQWQEGASSNVSIQIVCPAAPVDAMPRVTFASQDAIEAAPDTVSAVFEEMSEIGLIQKPS